MKCKFATVRRLLTCGAVSCGIGFGVAPPAHAKPTDVEQSMAQVLFEEGKRLLERGDVAEACSRFERSQVLDPAGGTLLNMAACHERAGRLATAWVEFHEALSAAMRDDRADREAFAREHIASLSPRLPRLLIKGEPCESCEIMLDARPLGRTVIDVLTPVDPGEHRLFVRGPAGEMSDIEVRTLAEGEEATMRLPRLVLATSPSAPRGSGTAPGTKAPTRAGRVAGVALLGTGAVALGIGTFFGLRALSLGNDANAACPGATCSDARGVELSNDANTSAWVANVSVGVAIVGLGLGTFLYFSSKPPSTVARDVIMGKVSF